MYKTFDVSGNQSDFNNSFDNPFDEVIVFLFFDASHIIRNIKNQVVQHKHLKVIIFYTYCIINFNLIIDLIIKNEIIFQGTS